MDGRLLQAALLYAERHGFSVEPVGADKRPLTKHGYKDFTKDTLQVRQ